MILTADLYRNTPINELARMFGLRPRTIQQKALRMGLRNRTLLSDLRAHLLERAVTGYLNTDIKGWNLLTIRCTTDRMRKAGLIFPGHVHYRSVVKFFDSAEKAESFAAEAQAQKLAARKERPKPAKARKTLIQIPRLKAQHRYKSGWGPDIEPRITAATVHTYAPPPPERVLWTNTHDRY